MEESTTYLLNRNTWTVQQRNSHQTRNKSCFFNSAPYGLQLELKLLPFIECTEPNTSSMQSRSMLYFCIYSYGLCIFYTVKYLDFFPLKHPNRLLQTNSEFPCRKTLDDPKWTHHISRGIIVVCDVKVTLQGFGQADRGAAASHPLNQIPACSGSDAGAGNIRASIKKQLMSFYSIQGFVVFRLSNGKSSIPCVRVCLCVLCADVRDSIPLSPMPSSPTVSLFSRMSSAPSMLLALKTTASSCSPSSHSHRCTSSSDQSAACSSRLASPGNPLPAKKRDRKPLRYWCRDTVEALPSLNTHTHTLRSLTYKGREC